jgi:MFS family permease
VWENRTLLALAWVAGLWQVLHHMQIAVLILFATRDLGLSAGAIGVTYMFGGVGCVLAAAFAERLTARFGVGPVIVHGLILTALGWQAFGLIGGPPWFATIALGIAFLVFDFGAVLYAINYLALRQAITPDRLLGRMTATMRFLTVAAAPLGSLAGGALATAIGLRPTLLTVGVLGLGLAAAAVLWSPVRRHRELPAGGGRVARIARCAIRVYVSARLSAVSRRESPSRISSRLMTSDGAKRTTSGPAISTSRPTSPAAFITSIALPFQRASSSHPIHTPSPRRSANTRRRALIAFRPSMKSACRAFHAVEHLGGV